MVWLPLNSAAAASVFFSRHLDVAWCSASQELVTQWTLLLWCRRWQFLPQTQAVLYGARVGGPTVSRHRSSPLTALAGGRSFAPLPDPLPTARAVVSPPEPSPLERAAGRRRRHPAVP